MLSIWRMSSPDVWAWPWQLRQRFSRTARAGSPGAAIEIMEAHKTSTGIDNAPAFIPFIVPLAKAGRGARREIERLIERPAQTAACDLCPVILYEANRNGANPYAADPH